MRRARRFVWVAAACLVVCGMTASHAAAQVVSPGDPCYKKLAAQGLSDYLAKASWGETDQLGIALLEIRYFLDGSAQFAEANAVVDPGQPAAMLAETRRLLTDLRDCLPWLEALASRLDQELKKRGQNVLVVPGDHRGRDRGKRLERERLAAEVQKSARDVAAQVQRLLRRDAYAT